ncbi:MAG: hypothetical protein ABJG78_18820 [Cyclobacteriaceae bacterium]
MSKPRVLCFLDNPTGRDTEIVLPIIYVMEKYLDAEVKTKFIWDLLYIKLWKPDVILLPNVIGHHMYVEAAAFARKNKIAVLALESEGNFGTDGKFDYWGYNTNKKIYQDWLTCWSERTKDYLTQLVDESDREKVILTGATGFDRFSFDKFLGKEAFFAKYGFSHFSKVVGYAGWAFGKLYGAHLDESFHQFSKWRGREEALEWIEEQRIHVREVLRNLIEKNPDTLFILKKHPKENFESDPVEGPNEMNELLDLENVIYLKTEESTADLINISDVWLGFETTTILEAWLLKTETILINKVPEFPRSKLFKGSVIASEAGRLQQYLNEYFETGKIADFYSEHLSSTRFTALKNSIGFSDGKNHLRSSYYFRKSIPEKHINKSVSLNLRHLRLFLLMHVGRFFFNKGLFLKLPKFRKTVYVFENRTLNGFQERKKDLDRSLDLFYQEHGFDSTLKNNNWDNFAP